VPRVRSGVGAIMRVSCVIRGVDMVAGLYGATPQSDDEVLLGVSGAGTTRPRSGMVGVRISGVSRGVEIVTDLCGGATPVPSPLLEPDEEVMAGARGRRGTTGGLRIGATIGEFS
jgi:hypothetical protein